MHAVKPSFSILKRLRRNRLSPAIRAALQETHILPENLVVPFFIVEGTDCKMPISSLPDIFKFSSDLLIQEAKELHARGVQAIALFPTVESLKTERGEEAWNAEGLLARTIREIKEKIPSLCLIADVALDPFTTHGHDGVLNEKGEVLNDATIECLIKMALMQAEAGVDFIAPSDMMDGRVKILRDALDREGFENVGILAYSAKYASWLYSPFREAVQSTLRFGDKRSYQLNPANQREGLLEALVDEEEGADILMVKPALHYLDVIAKLREKTLKPIAGYHVSGEYAMVMAAHLRGWLDAEQVFLEALLSIKRAGADLIFTYAAKKVLPFLEM